MGSTPTASTTIIFGHSISDVGTKFALEGKTMMKAIVLAALTTFTFTTTIAAAENTRKTFECPENVSIGLSTKPSKVFELYSQSLELERKNGQIILAKFGLYSGHPKEMGLLKAQKKKRGTPVWYYLDSSKPHYLGCSYGDDGHFRATNLIVVKLEGSFKKCTTLSNNSGVSCE